MNLDDLKSDWKDGHDKLSASRFDSLAANVVERTETMETQVRRRDLFEAAASVVVISFFGVLSWLVPLPAVAKVGMWIIMLAVIEFIAVLFWTRHRDSEPQNDLPLLDFCAAEIRRVDRQIHLWRNVTWWYSGPLLVGCGVFVLGVLLAIPAPFPAWQFYSFLFAFYACFVAVGIILYRSSGRAIKRNFLPFREELAEVVRSLQGDAER